MFNNGISITETHSKHYNISGKTRDKSWNIFTLLRNWDFLKLLDISAKSGDSINGLWKVDGSLAGSESAEPCTLTKFCVVLLKLNHMAPTFSTRMVSLVYGDTPARKKYSEE